MNPQGHWFLRARLKTRHLLLLVAVADEGNLHRAAEVLHMTQPAASKLLKDLEDVLDVTLFERLPRGMQPTWYGESMIRHARAALASLNKANEELEGLKTGRFGQVSVGAITSTGLMLLPPAVAIVKQEQPTLRVVLDVDTSDVLIERLAQGKLDILVARLFAQHDKSQVRYERLAAEPVCAVARPGHPLFKMRELELRDVAGHGWIVPPAGSVLRHRFELMFQEKDLVPPFNVVECSSFLFITRMLQQSDMLAVIALDVGRYYASHGIVSILPLEMPCQMDDFGIITRPDRALSPAAQVMMRALKKTSLSIYGRTFEHEQISGGRVGGLL